MRARNGCRSREDVCFPRPLLLNEIYRYLRATVLGPVETVDSGGSSLAQGSDGVLAPWGWFADKSAVVGDALAAGDRAGSDRAVDPSLCTGRCTDLRCDEWEHSDGSFFDTPADCRHEPAAKVVREGGMTGEENGSALGALPDPGGEFLDVIEDLTALGHLGPNLLLRVHDGGVVSAERLADLGQGEIGELAAQIHRDLT